MTMKRQATARGQRSDTDEFAVAGVSLWRRIADEIEQSIARGVYEQGSKLPGEIDIAARFGVNRHTVRRAIAALAERGVVRAERGSGTYVEARPLAYPIRRRTRFSEIVGEAGRAAGGRLIGSATEAADADVAQRLRTEIGAPVVRLETLQHADRVPLCVGTTWLSARRFPDAARAYASTQSMTRMLAHFGVRDYVRQRTDVTAAMANAADANNLNIALGRPLLVVNKLDADANGVPVLISRTRFAADRVALVIET
jgi:GntR family transcriptional regulator, phosphonate transport system regulatory protein